MLYLIDLLVGVRPFPNVSFIMFTHAAAGSWLSANCGTKMRSVCKKPKGGFIATDPTPPVAADYCPAGYFSVSGAYAAWGPISHIFYI